MNIKTKIPYLMILIYGLKYICIKTKKKNYNRRVTCSTLTTDHLYVNILGLREETL